MAAQEPESKLVTKAVAGDRVAIQQSLLTHTSAVSRFVVPGAIQGLIDRAKKKMRTALGRLCLASIQIARMSVN